MSAREADATVSAVRDRRFQCRQMTLRGDDLSASTLENKTPPSPLAVHFPTVADDARWRGCITRRNPVT